MPKSLPEMLRMFISTTAFQQQMPAALAPNGESYWQAFSLSLRTPWYLLTYRHQEDECEFINTAVIAWERTLLRMIEEIGVPAVVAISCIAPSFEDGAPWVMKQARELLLPAESERRESGPLLFVFEGEAGIFDSHQERVAAHKSGRTVLLNFPNAGASGESLE
jgi:hypothetical protein